MNELYLNKNMGVEIIRHQDLTERDLNSPLCIIGMPGIADVGKFAIDSLIGQLKADIFMEIIFDEYPAGAIIDDSLLSAPKAEILIWKDPEGVRDIILITADAQSLTPRGIYKISHILTEIIENLGGTLLISLGAYPMNSRKLNSKTSKVFATATNKELLEDFLTKNECYCEKIQKGVIIGANGLIPTLAKARFDIDGLVFLAETDNMAMVNEDITDLKASIALLEILREGFSLPIKKKYSIEKVADITKNLQNKKEQLERDLGVFDQYVEADDKRKSLYI